MEQTDKLTGKKLSFPGTDIGTDSTCVRVGCIGCNRIIDSQKAIWYPSKKAGCNNMVPHCMTCYKEKHKRVVYDDERGHHIL